MKVGIYERNSLFLVNEFFLSESYSKLPTVILYGVSRALSLGVFFAGAEELLNHSLPPLFKIADSEADLKLPDSQQVSTLFKGNYKEIEKQICRYSLEVIFDKYIISKIVCI